LAHGISNDEVYWILFGSGGDVPPKPGIESELAYLNQ
jgi:hypothetical protein